MSKFSIQKRRNRAKKLAKSSTDARFFAAVQDKQILTERLYTIEDFYTKILNVIHNPSKLIAENGYKLLDDTRADITVRSAVKKVFEGIEKLEWEIIKNDANQNEIDLAYTTIENLIKDNIIKQVVWAVMYGFQPLNVVWKKDGNTMMIDKIIEMPHDSVIIDKDRIVKLITENDRMNGIEVEPYRMLFISYDSSYKNPYGEGLFLNCFKHVFIKRNVLDFWTLFSEEYGSPGIIGKFSAAAANMLKMEPAAFVDYFYTQLEEMRGKRVFVHPEGTEVASIQAGSTVSSEIYSGLINHCKNEITGLILGHEAASSATPGKLGNDANAQSSQQNGIEAYTKMLTSHINELLKWQHDLNFGTGNACQIRFYEKTDIKTYSDKADYTQKLVDQGVRLNEDFYSEEFNLDKKYFTIDKTAQTPETKQSASAQVRAINSKFFNFRADKQSDKVEEDMNILDEFTEYVLSSDVFANMKDDTISTITDKLSKYDSYDDMLKNVYSIFEDLDIDNKKSFVQKFMLIAAVFGYNNEVENG
jgi:phage gp29-like protein